jgi:hypothetical protein
LLWPDPWSNPLSTMFNSSTHSNTPLQWSIVSSSPLNNNLMSTMTTLQIVIFLWTMKFCIFFQNTNLKYKDKFYTASDYPFSIFKFFLNRSSILREWLTFNMKWAIWSAIAFHEWSYDFYANRWRMCSISYYFRNSSASINNLLDEIRCFVKRHHTKLDYIVHR